MPNARVDRVLKYGRDSTTTQLAQQLQRTPKILIASPKPFYLGPRELGLRNPPGLPNRTDRPIPASVSGASPGATGGGPSPYTQHFVPRDREAQAAQHLRISQVLGGPVGAVVRASVATLLDRRSSDTSGARVKVEGVAPL